MNLRRLPNPARIAISAIESVVTSSNRFALYTARLRNLDGARAQMLLEQAAEMARTDAEPIGKVFHAAFIKCAICDEAKRTLYRRA